MAFLTGMFTVRAPGEGREQLRLPFIEPLVQGLYRAAADHKRGIPEVAGCRKQVGKPDIHPEDRFRVHRDRRFLKVIVKGHQDTELSVERLHLCLYISKTFIQIRFPDTEKLLLVYETQINFAVTEKELCRLVGPPCRGTRCSDISRGCGASPGIFPGEPHSHGLS